MLEVFRVFFHLSHFRKDLVFSDPSTLLMIAFAYGLRELPAGGWLHGPGLPALATTTSSPLATSLRMSEKWVFASWTWSASRMANFMPLTASRSPGARLANEPQRRLNARKRTRHLDSGNRKRLQADGQLAGQKPRTRSIPRLSPVDASPPGHGVFKYGGHGDIASERSGSECSRAVRRDTSSPGRQRSDHLVADTPWR